MGFAAPAAEQEIFPYSVKLTNSKQLKPCLENLERFVRRYEPLFYRVEQGRHAQTILKGLLSDLDRKTVEPIAVDHGQPRRGLQRFVGAGLWEDEEVLAEMQRHMVEEFGDPNGVIIIDPSTFPKRGTESVGVERQWCGRLGKTDNCQSGVFLGYASVQGGCLIDRRLYLPKSWSRRPKRRQNAHVPKEVRYRSRVRIADELLKKDAARFPHAWIVGDDEFGQPTWFRYRLGDRGERYLLEVPENTLIRDLEAPPPEPTGRRGQPRRRPFVRASKWAKQQPASRWNRFHVRDGEKGPLQVEAIRYRVQARKEGKPGREETILVTRTPWPDREYRYWMAPARLQLPLSEMVWAASMRHRVEEFIEWGKGESGLADYEVRSWVGWHHHMTLSLLAQLFLALEHKRLGKKGAGDDRTDDRPRDRQATA